MERCHECGERREGLQMVGEICLNCSNRLAAQEAPEEILEEEEE